MKMTSKRIMSLFLSLLMLMTSFSAFSVKAFAAYEEVKSKTVNDITWYYIVKKGEARIQGCSAWESKKTTITIPDKIGKYKVTAIDDAGWSENIKTVKIGKNLKEINGPSFNGFVNVTKFTVNSKNKYFATKDSVLFNKKITTLYAYPRAKKTSDYAVPKTVTKLIYGSFCFTENISGVDLSKTKIKAIPRKTFLGSSVAKVKFSPKLKKIETSAFEDSQVKEVKLPDSVKSIGEAAFNCAPLQTVAIGSSVEKIGTNAFTYSRNSKNKNTLKSITVAKKNKNYSSKDGVLFNKSKTELIQYPDAKKGTSYTVPSSVKKIHAEAFVYSKAEKVKFSSKLESVGKNAFYQSNIASAKLPKTTKTLGENSFGGCKKLKSVDLSDTKITKIGTEMFYGCTKLETVKFPSKLEKIGDSAFSGTKLKSIKLPSTVKSIEIYAFSGCGSLKTADLSKTKVEILEGTFSSCKSISEIKLPESLKRISWDFASNCKSLTKITIPKSVDTISGYSFYESGLQEITILGKDTYIESEAFPSNDGKTVEIFDEDGNTVDEIYLCYPRIIAPESSMAHDFANEYNYLFEAM